jgi:cysteinyl-tRNA synthetase
VVDPDDAGLTFEQNTILRNEGKIVLAYLSLGQAEVSRDYWQPEWMVGQPDFLMTMDPRYNQGFIVKFWTPEWQDILLNYTNTHIAPFGYTGILMDYMGEYKNFVDERPSAAQDMVDFGVKVANLFRSRNPQEHAIVVTQDSAELYRFPEYRDMIDGVSVEEAYYNHRYHEDKSISFGSQPAQHTKHQLAMVDRISKDKKVVFLIEYVDKNRFICDFYKKCAISGYICGVFDLEIPGAIRDCTMQEVKF